jgi:predicted O-methyltransferase YrrM
VIQNCPNLQRIVGVDELDMRAVPYDPYYKPKRTHIYSGTYTREFFEKNKETFDCIFIDASHKHEDVLSDFHKSIECLEDDGIIFMHDTYPPNDEFTSPHLCGTAFQTYLEISNDQNNWECVTLPIWCGLTIVRKRPVGKKLFTL